MSRDLRVSVGVSLKDGLTPGLARINGNLDKMASRVRDANGRFLATAKADTERTLGALERATLVPVQRQLASPVLRQRVAPVPNSRMPVAAGACMLGALASGPGLAAVATGAGILGVAKKSLDFERVLYDVQRATDKTGPELQKTGNYLTDLSRATGKTREELGQLYSAAGFAGRPASELAAFTEYAAKATTAWGTTAEATGQALAELGNIYKARQSRIQEIGDAVNTVADKSASKETDLLEFLRRVGATSNMVGMSAEKTLAFGGALKEVGVQSEVAATGFNAMLTKLSTLDDDDNDTLKKLGLTAKGLKKAFEKDAAGGITTLLEAINKVPGGAQKIELLTGLFGKEYADDIARLSGAADRVKELMAVVADKANYVGSVNRGFELVKDTDFNKIDRAKASLVALGDTVGNAFKQIGGTAAEGINKAVEAIEAGETRLQKIATFFQNRRNPSGAPEVETNRDFIPETGADPVASWLDKKFGATKDEAARKGRLAAVTERMGEQDAALRRAEDLRREAATVGPEGSPYIKRGGFTVKRERVQQEAENAGEIARRIGQERMANIERLRTLKNANNAPAFGIEGPNMPTSQLTRRGHSNFGFGPGGTDGRPAPTLQSAPVPPVRPAGLVNERQQIDVTGKVALEGKADVGVQIEMKPSAMFDAHVRTLVRSEAGNIKVNAGDASSNRGNVTDRP